MTVHSGDERAWSHGGADGLEGGGGVQGFDARVGARVLSGRDGDAGGANRRLAGFGKVGRRGRLGGTKQQ